MAFFTTTPHNTFSNPFSDLLTLLDTPTYPSYSTYHTPVFHHAPAYHTPAYLTYTPRRLSAPVHRRPSTTRRLPSPTVFRRSSSPSSVYQPVSALLTPPTIRKPRVSFMPRFDVRETADAYHLYGELAGVRKNDVEIEFLDVRRMAVRGKIVRDYERGVPVTQAKEQKIEEKKTEETQQEKKPDKTQEKKNEEATDNTEPQASSDVMDIDTKKPISEAAVTTEAPAEAATTSKAVESTETSAPEPTKATEAKALEDDVHSIAASHAKYQPTVEDSPDEDDRFSITSMSSTPSHSSAASHAAAKAAKAEAAEAEKKKADKEQAAHEAKEAPKRKEREEREARAKKEQALKMLREAAAEEIRLRRKQEEEEEEQMKYWVQERTVGEFERVFEFPERVRREDVHATLEDGVLKVVVPKVRDDEVRRVIIY